ncbi:MAG: UDP-N-acetylmuramoyl-L-alanine--D-glutamate ligase [Propionibacteriaceae bacterium]|nr:UDP-N-acetylmuramoyl-L-alanine--D-glutamate ligase [Propionibacteriaceae bacterium]
MGGGAVIDWLNQANRLSDWSQVHVTVAGIGATGYSAADALLQYGAQVTVLDEADTEAAQDKAKVLEILGATVRLGSGATAVLPQQCDLVMASPGWNPQVPLYTHATTRGIPIWGDVELAFRLQMPDRVVPWLGITGTNGKTTTVTMLESILKAAGLTVSAVGNVGRPILETVLDELAYDCLAVELSSFQLHWTHSMALHSAAVLNVDPDHMEWYAELKPSAFEAYCADKARIYHQAIFSCVYNVEDPRTEQMVVDADVCEGARAIGFTLGIPGMSMLGVVDDVLVDRAFIPQRRDSALEIMPISELPNQAPPMVANALAAASLARSFGVSVNDVREGLRNYEMGPHRVAIIAEHDGVTWVDDSKATNPHAASCGLTGFDSVVWIAGGLAKGAVFEELVRAHASRIKAAVLIGRDRGLLEQAFASQAPHIPVVSFESGEPSVMMEVVAQAARFADRGDTVLLAPACASQDIYTDYADRGDWFAMAVRHYMHKEGK